MSMRGSLKMGGYMKHDIQGNQKIRNRKLSLQHQIDPLKIKRAMKRNNSVCVNAVSPV